MQAIHCKIIISISMSTGLLESRPCPNTSEGLKADRQISENDGMIKCLQRNKCISVITAQKITSYK